MNGNHFIEISKSSNTGDYWITFHSGSRNLGKCVAEYHQKIACKEPSGQTKAEYIKYVKSTFPKGKWGEEIAKYQVPIRTGIPKGMEYLEGEDMFNYLIDMIVIQEYASLNRRVMKSELMSALIGRWGLLERNDGLLVLDEIETIHNFVDFEDWTIRKGAIRSYKGEKLILPFNMKQGILICEGKSNPEWNYSAPHGAGRVLSRSQAKKSLNQKDVDKDMEGIFTTCIPLDEAPAAYKDAKLIESCIGPTVDIIDRLLPVMNLKCKD